MLPTLARDKHKETQKRTVCSRRLTKSLVPILRIVTILLLTLLLVVNY
eukprot:COSAG06_NODE_35329_length_461_cov_1.093923_1_plen_47_part_10